ncbi:hypothetical protein ACHAWO_010436 [Cyclotella atomus]|uniref:Uncharacterized protein n=1 Tax=Cyclotella atomus TaxID=382360 RepID=A0ABD3N758_9STRA
MARLGFGGSHKSMARARVGGSHKSFCHPKRQHCILILVVMMLLFIVHNTKWLARLSGHNNNDELLSMPPNNAPAREETMATTSASTDVEANKKRHFAFIVGAAMNVHKYVDHVSTNLLRVANETFDNNYHIIISEEKSPHNWENTIPTDRLTVVRTENNPFHDRISRLAYARNQYLELVLQRYSEIQDQYEDCYMVVFDLDFTCEINFESIGKALPLRENWDAISFNVANYWDWYAFQALDHGTDQASRQKFLKDLNALNENELLEVTSAFHIAGMYKLSHLIDTKYVFERGECEHVGLHKMMKKKHNSSIMVSPMPIYRFGCI